MNPFGDPLKFILKCRGRAIARGPLSRLALPKRLGPIFAPARGEARARPQPRRQPAGARARGAARGRGRAIARGPLSRFEPVGLYGVPIVF